MTGSHAYYINIHVPCVHNNRGSVGSCHVMGGAALTSPHFSLGKGPLVSVGMSLGTWGSRDQPLIFIGRIYITILGLFVGGMSGGAQH